MARFFKAMLRLFVLISLVYITSAQNCRSHTFANGIPAFSACNDLPFLNSFLHWNYIPENRTVNLAYRHGGVSASRWVAWAINPSGRQMVGSQALVAFQSGGRMNAYTTQINGFQPNMQPGNLTFAVPSISAAFNGNNEITIFATIVLPPGSTSVNQVWQEGPLNGGNPGIHPLSGPNRQSVGTIDFQSGQIASGGANSMVKRRNVHGVLNAVSWGTLMPLGAIIARYLKVAKSADPAWFYLHIACQTTAYSVGVAGWATGLKLGSDSVGIQHNSHRNLGIALFVLGTLQVFALLLRPKPDHKFRFYWNIYHHATGYLVIILSVVNVYKGFDILDPEKKWKRIYTGVLVTLAAIAVLLEAFTWIVVIKRKKNEDKSHHGANGMNGYGARHQQGV
ncbi:Cytochrome b561 and domon domain-containing protein [Thalictrum thalictroides]|uniref:Cytochrome b561 and DOMON domain-containing protein n=1 Tax=Thalictrum thalictroides TaxID=46969 RepID=A0A7J6WKY9_THATH|nr:Cytochrome b561 and domon domain-containing protein [Thalictrum thalictroides]